MPETFRLVAIDGMLHFPFGGINATLREAPSEPSLLLKMYDAGDCDTVPWPLVSEHATRAELRKRLASALYDERETNSEFPSDASIELPDGTPFDFDAELGED